MVYPKSSRGHKKAACTTLIKRTFPMIGLQGKHHVSSDGITVVRSALTGVRLTAHHITGKEVDFDDKGLHEFLENLARVYGVGWLKKYEEVEYEYLDTGEDSEEEDIEEE